MFSPVLQPFCDAAMCKVPAVAVLVMGDGGGGEVTGVLGAAQIRGKVIRKLICAGHEQAIMAIARQTDQSIWEIAGELVWISV